MAILETYKEELLQLVELDPRGGHYLQRNFHESTQRCSKQDDCKELFDAWVGLNSFENHNDAITYAAYMYRDMLSHCREKARWIFETRRRTQEWSAKSP